MSARAGVFQKVKHRHALAEASSKAGSLVAVLKCGHARLTNLSDASANKGTMWCGICTDKRAAERREAQTKPEGRRAVKRAPLSGAEAAAQLFERVLERLDRLERAPRPSPRSSAPTPPRTLEEQGMADFRHRPGLVMDVRREPAPVPLDGQEARGGE